MIFLMLFTPQARGSWTIYALISPVEWESGRISARGSWSSWKELLRPLITPMSSCARPWRLDWTSRKPESRYNWFFLSVCKQKPMIFLLCYFVCTIAFQFITHLFRVIRSLLWKWKSVVLDIIFWGQKASRPDQYWEGDI